MKKNCKKSKQNLKILESNQEIERIQREEKKQSRLQTQFVLDQVINRKFLLNKEIHHIKRTKILKISSRMMILQKKYH